MGKIILLNGTSSSGKSSIAKILHKELISPPWMFLELDNFLNKLPLDHIQSQEEFMKILPKTILGFNSVVVTMADQGVNCIVDHVFQEDGWYKDFSEKSKEQKVFTIGLHCPIKILEEREKAREDREVGLAASQIDKVHRGITYSMELDTSIISSVECAKKIMDLLN